MTSRPTHADGIAAAQQIAEEHGLTLADLRPYAADRLSEHWPADEGMGSSDVSGQLADLGNHEPDALREEAARLAERNALVTRIATSTGRSFDETLTGLQSLFAPADSPVRGHAGPGLAGLRVTEHTGAIPALGDDTTWFLPR